MIVPSITVEKLRSDMDVVSHFSGGLFIVSNVYLLRFLKGDGSATMVLSRLLNVLKMRYEDDRDRDELIHNGGEFLCPAGKMQEFLGMSKDRFSRVMNTLEQVGLIHTRHGKGNFLHVKVDVERLREIQSNEQKAGKPQSESGKAAFRKEGKPQSLYTKEPIERNSEPCCPQAVNGERNHSPGEKSSLPRSSNGHQPNKPKEGKSSLPRSAGSLLAEELYQGLNKAGKITRPPRIPSWGRELDKLISFLAAERELLPLQVADHIRLVIQFHVKNIRDKYQPKCYSAESVCREFARIEDSMKRAGELEGSEEQSAKFETFTRNGETFTRSTITYR